MASVVASMAFGNTGGHRQRAWCPDDDDRIPNLLAKPEPWMSDPGRACAGVDPEVFFPPGSEGVARAKRICAKCPADLCNACLEYALRNREDSGVWGGTSERERRRLLRAMRAFGE